MKLMDVKKDVKKRFYLIINNIYLPIKILIVFIIIVPIQLFCDINSGIPPGSYGFQRFPELKYLHVDIVGLYDNSDVDCELYKVVRSDVFTSNTLLEDIIEGNSRSNWHENLTKRFFEHKTSSINLYKFPIRGGLEGNTFELIHIVEITSNTILMGWIQSDNLKYSDFDTITAKSGEFKWAKSQFWIKYKSFYDEMLKGKK